MIYNRVVIKLFEGAAEVAGVFAGAENIRYAMGYPGGMCTGMTWYVARRVDASWPVRVGMRVAAFNGLRMVWEGWITQITASLTDSQEGSNLVAAGAWATFLMARKTIKPWADTRINDGVWRELTTAAGYGQYSLDRQSRILFTPTTHYNAGGTRKGWSIGDYGAVVYTAPSGETVKRVTFGYDLQEGAQAWQAALETSGGANLWNVEATGTGTVDHALATPVQGVRLVLRAMAGQTPPTDGTIYAKYTDVTVYTETGAIDGQAIVGDVAGLNGEISSDLSQVGALGFDLVPFVAETPTSYADILTRVVKYGDGSYNRWGGYLDLSAGVSDGKPRMVLEQEPALTDWDYGVRVDDEMVEGELNYREDLDGLCNWIGVEYQDANGRAVFLTPEDDPDLTDSVSVGLYGRRDFWVRLATTDAAAAKNYGMAYLAAHRLPQWVADGAIKILGYVRGKNGVRIAASEVRPGRRLRVENWLRDLAGTGLTLLVTGTVYTDGEETCQVTVGKPERLEMIVAQMERVTI